eukprot:1539463-Amphidinium_carterae.1
MSNPVCLICASSPSRVTELASHRAMSLLALALGTASGMASTHARNPPVSSSGHQYHGYCVTLAVTWVSRRYASFSKPTWRVSPMNGIQGSNVAISVCLRVIAPAAQTFRRASPAIRIDSA